jgi:hypothetical protein
MAKKSANKNAPSGLTLEQQTAAFLESGGKITQIPSGISGQTNLSGPKHITLGNKNNQTATQK